MVHPRRAGNERRQVARGEKRFFRFFFLASSSRDFFCFQVFSTSAPSCRMQPVFQLFWARSEISSSSCHSSSKTTTYEPIYEAREEGLRCCPLRHRSATEKNAKEAAKFSNNARKSLLGQPLKPAPMDARSKEGNSDLIPASNRFLFTYCHRRPRPRFSDLLLLLVPLSEPGGPINHLVEQNIVTPISVIIAA